MNRALKQTQVTTRPYVEPTNWRNKMDEEVLTIPTSVFHAAGLFQGFRPESDYYTPLLFKAENFQFLPRSKVETDPGFKQLIPYVVFRHGLTYSVIGAAKPAANSACMPYARSASEATLESLTLPATICPTAERCFASLMKRSI